MEWHPRRRGRWPGRARRAPLAWLPARILLGSVLLWGCDPGDGAASSDSRAPAEADAPGIVAVTDDAGRRWAFDAPPERILSLVPSATQALIELGEGARLVGRTDYDLAPEVAALPSVGGGLEPSLEVVLSLAPDVVIRFHGPSDVETPRRLDAAGIPHVAVRPDTIGDVVRMVGLVGTLSGREAEAAALVRRIGEELDAVERAVEGVRRPRVGILLGGDPPWVAGGATFLHELVEIAGGTNVFADEGPLYAPISVEEVLRRGPDLLLMTEAARVPAGLRGLPVVRVPSSIQSPGPGVGSSALEIARRLHPDRFR